MGGPNCGTPGGDRAVHGAAGGSRGLGCWLLATLAIGAAAAAAAAPAGATSYREDVCAGHPPVRGEHCISLPVKMVPVTTTTPGGCGEGLFMQVPLEPARHISEYEAVWGWELATSTSPWVFRASGGSHGTGSGPYGEEVWSTTALTPQNTGVNVHYTVPKGYGAWFVAAGGGPGPCEVKTGQAVAWAWAAAQKHARHRRHRKHRS